MALGVTRTCTGGRDLSIVARGWRRRGKGVFLEPTFNRSKKKAVA